MTKLPPQQPPREFSKPVQRWVKALGLCAGSIGLLSLAGLLAAATFKPVAQRNKCWHQLRSLGCAIAMYEDANRGKLPASWQDLAISEQITASIFICPSSQDSIDRSKSYEDQLSMLGRLGKRNCSYIYTGDRVVEKEIMQGSDVLGYEPMGNHGNGMHVLLSNDDVIWLSASADADKIGHLIADNAAGIRPLRPR